jgi:hypothetical protein
MVLALLSFVFILTAIKVMGAEEVLAQHIESIFIQFDLIFRQMLSKKVPHQLASPVARLGIAVVERFWMRFLQKVVELRAIRIRQTNEMTRGVHPWRPGEILVGTLFTKMLLSLRARHLENAHHTDGRGEMNHSLALVTCFAQHRANYIINRERIPPK